MSNFIELSDEQWKEVAWWTITPVLKASLDLSHISLNFDDRNGYKLISEDFMNSKGLTSLEFHILMHLDPEDNDINDVLMLDIPFMMCGSGGPTQEQLDAPVPETTLSESVVSEYFDQPKVLEAIRSLQRKGRIIISCDRSNET